MPSKVTVYDLLISCPGDVEDAVKIIDDVVETFNQKYNTTLSLGIRTRYWKKSSYPQSGGKPQELLNKQFIEDCDLAVAIFKTRFGTPTDKYGSGSEEEIEIMLNAGRQVFLYFDDSPVSPSDIDAEQYQKVKDFKKKYRTRGIYFSYKSLDEFRNFFDAHITQYFLTLEKVNEITNKKSDLMVSATCEGRFEQEVRIQSFSLGKFEKSKDIIEQIKKLMDVILKYEVTAKVNQMLSPLDGFMNKEAEIEDSTKDLINKCAEGLGFEISDDFFNLGNLRENTGLSIIGGNSLSGSDSEIKKYNSIIELRDLFYKLFGHLEMEEYYSHLQGVQLVLCNEGTNYDEDIEVTLRLPKYNAILPSELKVPNHEVGGNEDWCFEDIFGISATKDYISHAESKQKKVFGEVHSFTPVHPYQTVDYEEEYRETISDIFEYKYFEDGEYQIIKCNFDYIKQHQRVAFPTWIFLKNIDESEIKIDYEITSKNEADILKGEIVLYK